MMSLHDVDNYVQDDNFTMELRIETYTHNLNQSDIGISLSTELMSSPDFFCLETVSGTFSFNR